MTPLPGTLARDAAAVAWRLDAASYAPVWDSGVGAEQSGGRWNPKGVKVVYASFDPSTTILESAVHRGFHVLDTRPFVLTGFTLLEPDVVKVVQPQEIPNPAWLVSGIPSAGQQHWGAELLDAYPFVVLPSVVSRLSWNVIFRPDRAHGRYVLMAQTRLATDTRLNPPAR